MSDNTESKVLQVNQDAIEFENGIKLFSSHDQDCCESHYLSFADLTIDDFKGLEFDLTGDDWFKKIDGYGIELIPNVGHSVKIPGYGFNNGYYSSQLTLWISDEKEFEKTYDISECQVITD